MSKHTNGIIIRIIQMNKHTTNVIIYIQINKA
jgi:hypothetical protein